MRVPRMTIDEMMIRQMWCLTYLAKAISLTTGNPKVFDSVVDVLQNGVSD